MSSKEKVGKAMNGNVKHFGDFPNDVGFSDIPETKTPIELKVTGKIPSYVHGVLYRTGPGSFTTPLNNGQIFAIQHWFDGFALQHRFEITPEGKVFYRSRRTCDEYIKHLQQTGSIPFSFGQRDLCDSFFHKFFTMFKRGNPGGGDAQRNVNVTLTPNFPVGAKLADKTHRDKTGLRNLYVKTDSDILRSLDPVTLEPIESTTYGKVLGKDDTFSGSAAHPATDPQTGELFNFVLKPGRKPTYVLFKLTPPTQDKPAGHKILAEITDAPAAYIHSVCLSKKYFVFCVWQADYYMNGASILYNRNLTQSFKSWDPNRKALWYIVDRENGGVVRKYESDTFFAFHHTNSYDDGDDIVVDMVTYKTHDVCQSFYLESLKSSSATKPVDPPPQATRILFKDVTASKSVGTATVTTTNVVLELQTISPAYYLRPNKYAYGASSRGLSSLWDSIVKVDLEALYRNPANPPESAVTRFERPKCTPSEPIFVPRPGGTREDDGVVLIIELDGVKGKSALVVIDAQSFKEIGRAEVEGKEFVVPHHFHGAWCGDL